MFMKLLLIWYFLGESVERTRIIMWKLLCFLSDIDFVGQTIKAVLY